MATQTIEASATTGLTITGKLFAVASDVIVDTVVGTEKTNNQGRYTFVFTDIPAGVYELKGFVGGVGGFISEMYTLTLTTNTFLPHSESGVVQIRQEIDSNSTKLIDIVADTNELQLDWVNGGRLDNLLDGRATPAQVAAELLTYDGPTYTEMTAAFTQIKGAGWSVTDTLEALRDRGDAAWLTGPTSTQIADAILTRNVSNVEASAGEHTLCTVVLAMLENSISSTTLTIKRTDGVTTHYTKTLTTSPTADPITGIN